MYFFLDDLSKKNSGKFSISEGGETLSGEQRVTINDTTHIEGQYLQRSLNMNCFLIFIK